LGIDKEQAKVLDLDKAWFLDYLNFDIRQDGGQVADELGDYIIVSLHLLGEREDYLDHSFTSSPKYSLAYSYAQQSLQSVIGLLSSQK